MRPPVARAVVVLAMGATRCPVGTYRAWLAPRSNTGIVVAVLAAVGLLAMPASVEASLYIWNVDANGSWTTASNWLYAGAVPTAAIRTPRATRPSSQPNTPLHATSRFRPA